MGSGFRTFAASEVLTGSNVQNFLMEQSVMSFASTGARDVAVTSPEVGMVAFIRSNDSSEGLYHYTSASSWRRGPGWNAPWGVVGVGTATADVTPATVAQTSIGLSTGAMSLFTNRRYEINYTCTILGSAAPGQTFTFELWDASAKVISLQSQTVAGTAYFVASGVAYATVTTSSPTWTVRCLSSGGGGVTFKHSVSPGWLTVKDIGPSGAPA